MALSYAHSIGDGSNRNFDVPCEYLSKSHVSVRVDGVDVPFVWLDTYRVQTATPPAAGTVVEVRRTTPRKDRLVVFTDGSTLVQSDLNTSTLQSFFLSQEAFDQGSASMAVTEDGQFSALTRRITSLADPVNPQDAVTRLWAETAMSSQLTAATQKAAEALASATRSEASAVSSDGRAVAALGYKNDAASSASAAAQSKTDAIAAKNQTQLDRAATAADRVQTGLDRAAAAASAAAAKQSADDAALFDPTSYYTKVQVDGSFYTKSVIDTKLGDYYGKTDVDTKLGGKLDKTGGEIAGDLKISSTGPTLRMFDTDRNETRWVHHNDGTIGFVASDGAWAARVSDDGNIWLRFKNNWISNAFADRGARVQRDTGIWEFGAIDPQYNDLTQDAPAPWVLVGLRSGRGTNVINLRAVMLRNN